MVSVSANRALTHFEKRHFCRLHVNMIDRAHNEECDIHKCDILSRGLQLSVTHYNETLRKTSIHDLPEQEFRYMDQHYIKFEQTTRAYEERRVFLA